MCDAGDRVVQHICDSGPFFGGFISALGAQLYVGARLVYVLLYAAGVPYLRTAVWTTAMVGLVMVLSPAL